MSFLSINLNASGPQFAQCQADYLGKQKIAADSNTLSEIQRMLELEQLLLDLRSIVQSIEQKAKAPRAFLTNCVQQKKSMVEAHSSKLPATTKKTHKYLKLMGQITETVMDYRQALVFYAAAFETNESDKDSGLKAIALQAQIMINEFEINDKTLSKDQKLAMLNNYLSRTFKIANNHKFTKEERLYALDQARPLLAFDDIKKESEENYWKKYIEIEPSSELALRELVKLYKNKSDYRKMSIYAAKLAESPKVLESDIEDIGYALVKAEDYASLLKHGMQFTNKFAKNAEAWGYLGIAEHELKLTEKSLVSLKKSLAMKSQNPLVRTKYSLALENMGDKAAEDKNWIDAMGYYKESLSYNKESNLLKKKTAYLILDYYSENKFPKNTSTQKDMDYALSLLNESLNTKVPLMADYAAAIQLAAHSSKPNSYVYLCDKYQSEQASGLTMDIVKACVAIYNSAQKPQQAKKLVDFAVSKIPNAPSKKELLQTIR